MGHFGAGRSQNVPDSADFPIKAPLCRRAVERLIVNELRFHNFQILHKSIIIIGSKENFLSFWILTLNICMELFSRYIWVHSCSHPGPSNLFLLLEMWWLFFSQPGTCNFVLTFEDVMIKPRIIVKKMLKVNKCWRLASLISTQFWTQDLIQNNIRKRKHILDFKVSC